MANFLTAKIAVIGLPVAETSRGTMPERIKNGFQRAFGECEDYAINVVPEPTTMSLLAIGNLLLLRRRRCRVTA